MAKIHQLTIKNFRGINNFHQVFSSDFVCLIGRGDSGKSSILEAIGAVLSSSWNVQFFDNDFHNCNTSSPIEIEATLKELPEELLREDKYGMYQRGLDPRTGKVFDEIEDDHISVLTIKLEIGKDLEPHWSVITDREIGSKDITASDRAKLNTILVSDYIDRHFSWNKGSPLYTLLRQEDSEDEDGTHMIDALRAAKINIDTGGFGKFDIALEKVKNAASTFGMNISKSNTTIDFRDIVTKDGKVCLHDEKIPFRLKGKGSKRLISIAIQSALAEAGGIALIDEIEQGLEPDRVQQLVNSLRTHNHSQIFITTHSRDVLVELSNDNIFLMRAGANQLVTFNKDFQGTLRKNPEAFFAKYIIVCEGPTEIGLCKALNHHRIKQGKKNIAYIGVRLADGGGTQMIDYATRFHASGFQVCLFCDSDNIALNEQKKLLKSLGVEVIDWDNDDCLETAIMRDLSFEALPMAIEHAVVMRHEKDDSIPLAGIKSSMWDSVKAKYGVGCPDSIENAIDTDKLRLAIASASIQNKWYKSQNGGYQLGTLILENFETLPDCKLKNQLNALSLWIDNHGS